MANDLVSDADIIITSKQQGLGSCWVGKHIHMAYPNSTESEPLALESLPELALWTSYSCSFVSFIVKYNSWCSFSLSSVNLSNELLHLRRGVVGTPDFVARSDWSMGNLGTWNLSLVSEVRGQSYRTDSFKPMESDSRIEL